MQSKVLTIIKKLLLEFVVVVFLIGFFSSSFANYTVPKVNSVLAYSGNIYKSYPVEGQIEYQKIHKVRLGTNVIIDENLVDVGKRVQEGDPIFRINLDYGIYNINQQLIDLEVELQQEKLKLMKLQESDNLIDEKKISLMRSDLNREEKKLIILKELYDEGAISLQEYEDYKHKMEALQGNLFIEEIKYSEKQKEREIQIEEADKKISEISRNIETTRRRSNFYSKVGEDGIYYAEKPGIIYKNGRTNTVLSSDEPAVEIAIVGDQIKDLKFAGYIKEEYGKDIKLGDIVDVELYNQQNEIRFKIEYMYFVEDRNAFKIEGQLMRELPSNILVNRNYKGEIKKLQKGNCIIPKSAIIASSYTEGEKGRVYIIETTEGILGKQYIAREVEVVITGVGDQIIVDGLEEYENVRVITTLSHRVRDGVKVTHGF